MAVRFERTVTSPSAAAFWAFVRAGTARRIAIMIAASLTGRSSAFCTAGRSRRRWLGLLARRTVVADRHTDRLFTHRPPQRLLHRGPQPPRQRGVVDQAIGQRLLQEGRRQHVRFDDVGNASHVKNLTYTLD